MTPPLSPTNYLTAHRSDDDWLVDDPDKKPVTVSVADRNGFTIAASDLSRATELFRHDGHISQELKIDLFGLYYRAAYSSQMHDFQTSLPLAWVVIEKCQNILWERFVSGGYKSFNTATQIDTKRRNILSGRDYTVAILSQILSICGIYTDQELKDIEHNLENVTSNTAFRAQHTAGTLLSKVLGTRFALFGGPIMWG
jgi:hypothetical protein